VKKSNIKTNSRVNPAFFIYKEMKYLFLFFILFFGIANAYAQEERNLGQIHGNFETIIQTYRVDTLINIDTADIPKEKALSNSFLNLTYTRGKFTAGIRYEAYLNTLLGFDDRYDGHGIANRYASYQSDELLITVGNFYEQFGNGLVLRAYEEKTLGVDNSFDGVKLNYQPVSGIRLKGLIGTQRYYWDKAGLVKGVDAEISFNETFKKLSGKLTNLSVGGSFVSKYEDGSNDPDYNFPDNVAALSGRLLLTRKSFYLNAEYAHKTQDPSADNSELYGHPLYKDGNALFINTSWSTKGFGFLLSGLRIDNMSYKSNRNALLNDLTINYLPSIAKSSVILPPSPLARSSSG
jgi:hypothetical protein